MKHKKHFYITAKYKKQGGTATMLNLNIIIEKVFLIKKADIQKEYEKKLLEIENEEKVLTFIIEDLEKGVVFGNKDKNINKWNIQEIFKKLNIKEQSIFWGLDFVCALKGLGFKAEKRSDPDDCIVIIDNPYL